MKKFGKILVAVLIFGLLVVIPAAAQKTKADFQKMYMDFLKKKKMECKITNDGGVSFMTPEGSGYYIIINENEPQRFCVYTFVHLAGHPMGTTMQLANTANSNTRCVKISISDDGEYAFFIFQGVLPKPKDFSLVFDKILATIDDTVWYFVDLFN